MISKNQSPDEKVDKWIRTLRELVSWAKNEKNNEREGND